MSYDDNKIKLETNHRTIYQKPCKISKLNIYAMNTQNFYVDLLGYMITLCSAF